MSTALLRKLARAQLFLPCQSTRLDVAVSERLPARGAGCSSENGRVADGVVATTLGLRRS
eukprot:2582442-Pleurochrysis_carterae.AAC.3